MTLNITIFPVNSKEYFVVARALKANTEMKMKKEVTIAIHMETTKTLKKYCFEPL